MTERLWLRQYPAAVAHDIDPTQIAPLTTLFDESARRFGALPAFTNMGHTLTYTEVDDLAKRFAAWLQQKTDLKPGDRIALQMPNLLQYPVAMMGALRAGLVVVNVNPLYTPREMAHQFRDAGVKAIVILDMFADKLEEVLAEVPIPHVVVTSVGDLLGFLKGQAVNLALRYIKRQIPAYHLPQAVSFKDTLHVDGFQPVALTANDLAFLQYTGGTTGVAKGAMLTHGNLSANLLQVSDWMSILLEKGKETVITALPMYHVFALTVNCFVFYRWGAHNILITNPRDLPGFVKDLGRYRYTVLTGVNTLFNALLHNDAFRQQDFSALKIAAAGGMALQTAVAEEWLKVTGKPVLEGYGLTEASPVVSFNPTWGGERPGSIGFPLPSTDVKIVDENSGEILPAGERGELCVQGPQVMRGYWQRPEETAGVLKDGWLHTGDVAVMEPDGRLRIVDRIKDMIIVSGFKVFPNEVEEEVAKHPGVREVAAIGVPDEHSGEAVKIVVVRKDPNLTEADLRAFCREGLTGYKLPRIIEFRTEELPKSNVGKILRRLVREQSGG